MQKTAVGILIVGLAWALLVIPAFGIDLLIDAVGYLLVFNASRALKYWHPAFAPAAWFAAALVPVTAMQLFFTAPRAAFVLQCLRTVGEMGLFICLGMGLGALLAQGQRKQMAPLAATAFYLSAAAGLAAFLVPLALPAVTPALSAIALAAHIFILTLLFFTCILPGSLLY